MRRNRTAASAARRRSSVLLALSLTAALGLAGCGSIDEMLFGGEEQGEAQPEAPAAPQAPAAQQPTAQQPTAGTLPGMTTGTAGETTEGTLPAGTAQAGTATAGVTPVTIEPGTNTGTAVNHTIQDLRSQVSGIQDKLLATAQQLADLRTAAAQSAQQYIEAKANIGARLQLGTTRGNPELVSQWNTAQAALDAMTSNINSLNAVGTNIANESSDAHSALNTIQATFEASGAVDEDHHQLAVLRDETNQIIVLIDSLLSNVSDTVRRQTAYIANERTSLAALANAIKSGSYYGDLSSPTGGAAGFAPASGSALVTIRFDRPHVDYQQILYTAVAQALQSRPSGSFAIVAVSPTRGTAAAIQLAQTAAERHARDVVRSLSDMGIPASRLDLSSTTDPNISASEVRVYLR